MAKGRFCSGGVVMARKRREQHAPPPPAPAPDPPPPADTPAAHPPPPPSTRASPCAGARATSPWAGVGRRHFTLGRTPTGPPRPGRPRRPPAHGRGRPAPRKPRPPPRASQALSFFLLGGPWGSRGR